MKPFILSITMFLSAVTLTHAQCGSLPFFQLGKKIVFTTTMGQRVTTATYTVKNVANEGGAEVATFDTKIDAPPLPGGNRKPSNPNSIFTSVKCLGESLTFVISAPLPGNGTLAFNQDYPLNMKVGDALSDISASSDINIGSGTSHMTTVMHRKVEAMEKVTTPAGTWDCYKISIITHTEITGMQIPAANNDVQSYQWFCPSIGLVKVTSTSTYANVTSELTSIQ